MQTIGEKIKVLRREAGLSQQQLADKLGLSNQAISKWETNTAQPEIGLLPELAMVFGVSIDELFDYTKEKYLDKIEGRLDSGQFLSMREIAEYERFLQEKRLSDSSLRQSELLAYLYFHCGENFMEQARPNDKSSLSIITQTSKGFLFDWDVRNHTDLIDYYIKTLEQNPEQTAIYLYLLDNLLDDWRLLFSVDNSLSAHGCYEEVIPIWEAAYEAQEKPRFTDYHLAIAQCYLLLGNKAGAIQAYQKVIDILKTDWNCRFGRAIDEVEEKIRQLT